MKCFLYTFVIALPCLFSFTVSSQSLHNVQRYAFTAHIETLRIHENDWNRLESSPSVEELFAYQAENKIPYIATDMIPNFVLRLHLQSEAPQGVPFQKGAIFDFGIHSPTLFFSGIDILDGELTVHEHIKEKNLPFIVLYMTNTTHAVYKLVFDWIRYVEGELTSNLMNTDQRKDLEERKAREESMIQQLEKSLIEEMETITQQRLEDDERK